MALGAELGGLGIGDDAALCRTALAAAPLVCLGIRAGGEIAYANPAAVAFYGRDPVGCHIGALSVHATRDNWPQLWQAHAGPGAVRIQALHRSQAGVIAVAITAHFDLANGYVIE